MEKWLVYLLSALAGIVFALVFIKVKMILKKKELSSRQFGAVFMGALIGFPMAARLLEDYLGLPFNLIFVVWGLIMIPILMKK